MDSLAKSPVYLILTILGITIIAIIIIIILVIYFKTVSHSYYNLSTPANVLRITNEQTNRLTLKFATNVARKSMSSILSTIPQNQQVLANFSILTSYNPGYLGPFMHGVYSEEFGTQLALTAGARAFFLTIDFDKNDLSFTPLLISRNTNGIRTNLDIFLMNGNKPVPVMGGDPGKVLKSLAQNAFTNPQTSDPLIVYLFFNKLPKDVRKKDEFLTKVERMLGPLWQKNDWDFNRKYASQQLTDSILISPVKNYQNKVLIFSNIDTSTKPHSIDYMIHLKFFTNSTTAIGETPSVKDANLIRGYIQNIDYYIKTPPDRVGNVVLNTMINWNIVVQKEEVTDLSGSTECLDKFGCQMVLFDMFGDSDANNNFRKLYDNSSFRVKPAISGLRYTIPEPIKIAAQNPKLNSNQGILTAPTAPVQI